MRRFVLLAVCSGLGCSSSVDPLEGGEGTEDGSSSGAADPTQLPVACDGAPSQLDPLHGAVTCDDLRSVPVGEDEPPIEIAIVNLLEEAIIVPDRASGCHHELRPFHLVGMAGTRSASTPFDSCVGDWPVCDQFFVDPELGSCLLCGTVHRPRRIEPGGRMRIEWRPQIAIDAILPASCSGEAEDLACAVAMRAPLGQYELESLAAPTRECPLDCAEGGLPDADGTCVVGETPESCEYGLSARASWDGACREVVIVFGDPR